MPGSGSDQFRLGFKAGCPLIVAALAYCLLTADRPHRALMLGLIGGGAVVAVSVVMSPIRDWIMRRNVTVVMTVWCASFIVLAIVLADLDTGLTSPFVGIFFVSVAYAAAALPRRQVILIAALNLLALVLVGIDPATGSLRGVGTLLLLMSAAVAIALVSTALSGDRSRRTDALRSSQEEIVHRLARVVEFRDNETGGHVERMSRYSMLVAEELGWTRGHCRQLQLAAGLHDVGKVAVPDAILLKPGPLTPAERAVMERHCQAGFDMLSGTDSPLLRLAATIALTHHERFDGGGYPTGLAGAAIPIEGRITAVADVFDALTSARVYKDAMPIDDAVELIREGRGTQFDPDVVDAFLRRLDEVASLHTDCPPDAGSAQPLPEPDAVLSPVG